LKSNTQLTSLNESIEKTQIIQGDKLQKELSEIEENIVKDIKPGSTSSSNANPSLPKVIFDPMNYKTITTIGAISKSILFASFDPLDFKNMRICYFGEKNKVLIYSIDRDEWKLTQLPYTSNYEFNYYSSAVTLPNGTVLVTGGGISNVVYQVVISPSFNRPAIEVIPKASMNQTRKEHASVFLQNSVYVLGGYDGTMNSFLNSCERYDLETDEWKSISPMLVAKCAFGATTVGNRYIFAVGGYDGHERLSSIERYDVKLDKWALLDVQLKQPLSNSACFAFSDSGIVILGGGYNIGFCLEVNHLDINSSEWTTLAQMSDGRDLRNKLVSVNGQVYAIGGNNCLAERYSMKRNEWGLLSSYQNLVNDNLDSWACALYYEIPGKPQHIPQANEELRATTSMMRMYQGAGGNYQMYQYEEGYDDEGYSENSSLFEEFY
jgi:Kelch motif